MSKTNLDWYGSDTPPPYTKPLSTPLLYIYTRVYLTYAVLCEIQLILPTLNTRADKYHEHCGLSRFMFVVRKIIFYMHCYRHLNRTDTTLFFLFSLSA